MSSLSVDEEMREICDSKTDLEALIHQPIHTFIYPVGKIGTQSVHALKKCGYSLAWSTSRGKFLDWNHPEPFIMNRIRIHHHTPASFFESFAKKPEK